MICDRCHQPIRPDEPYSTFTPDSGNAPTVYLHERLCEKAPHQSVPERIGLY